MSGHGRRGRGGGGHGGGGGGHGGWLVTYADLLTLLMVLFLVLWVIAKIDLKKFEKFKEGLGDFGNPATQETNTGAGSGDASSDSTTTTTTLPPVVSAPGALGADGTLTGTGLDELTQTLETAIEQAGLSTIVSVQRDERGVVLTVSTDDLLFDSGSATLKPNGVYVLAALSQPLHGFNNQILVGGHTDKRPLSSPNYTNFNLSFDRAAAVVNLLVDRFGIPAEHIFGAGYGASRPVAEGDDAESLARNRRVEIVVLATNQPPDAAAGEAAPTSEAPPTVAPETSAPSPLIPATSVPSPLIEAVPTSAP